VQQAASPEVVDRLLVHALVVAQHHALEDLADRRIHPRAQMSARRLPEAVDEALQPSPAPCDAQVGERPAEQHVLAAAAKVAPVVELAGLGGGERLDRHACDGEKSALDQRTAGVQRECLPFIQVEAKVRRLAQGAPPEPGHRDRERDPVAGHVREVGEDGLQAHGLADERAERGALHGRQPAVADGDAGDEEEGGQDDRDRDQRASRQAPARPQPGRDEQAAETHGRGHADADRPGPYGESDAQPATVRGEDQMRRGDGAAHAHTVTKSFRAANFASPMPGTSLSCSTLVKPPLAVR